MKINKIFLVFFLFWCISDYLYAQHTDFQADSIRLSERYGEIVQIYFQTEYDSAAKAFQKLAEEAEQLQQPLWKAKAHQGLGLSLDELGRYTESATYIFDALDYFEEIGHEQYLAQAYGNIGSLYFHQNQFTKSLEYHQKSARLNEKLGQWYGVAASYNNIGSVYEAIDSIEKSQSANFKALAMLKKVGDTRSLGMMYNNIANIYLRKENFDSANYYVQLGLKEIIENKQTGNYDLLYLNIARVKEGFKQYDSALYYYQKSLALSEASNDFPRIKITYHDMARLYSRMGNYQKAYETQRRHSEISDSIASLRAAEQMNALTIQYETQEKENQIALQNLEISRQKNRQLILGGAIVFILLWAVFGYVIFRNRQKAAKMEIQAKQADAEKLQEIDRIKSHFFANISHEFRTPLTLILGPLDKLINKTYHGNPQTYFQLMRRNARRLLELINQLLDLSRIEAGKMKLNLASGDIMAFLRVITGNFESFAESKNIRFHTHIGHQEINMAFDRDKLEKTVNNLLSNAFKFTPEEGDVWLSVEKIENTIEITVRDNGIGIPEETLEHIFDRFYRVEGHELKGTGIGLALVKEIVDLHKGQIQVSSTPGEGSMFVVKIPVTLLSEVISPKPPQLQQPVSITPLPEAEPVESLSNADTEAPLILMVEDNEDIRLYIKTILDADYRILEAEHGQKGWKTAQEYIPDLIISDVMMPEMDGYAFTEKIKTDPRTSHIPVIMLTAKAGHDSKIQGLSLGADDYLKKPFDEEELTLKIKNLLVQQKRLSQKLKEEIVSLHPEAIEVESADKKFLNQLIDIIENYMADETFSVEDMGREIGMSRSQLHRKLKALTDQSPSVFLRTIRLKRARQLLEAKAGNVGEIAFQVGFNTQAYFNKCFRDQFGITPGEVLSGSTVNS
ncbi:MAG: ATP-binding protein [Bacteroidia bacterium]